MSVSVRLPYQLLVTAWPQHVVESSRGFLLAACGSRLVSTNLDNGEVASEWPSESSHEVLFEDVTESDQRPKKKQKISNGSEDTTPDLIKLVISNNQQYVVAVSDDKLLRVLQLGPDGRLCELSSRAMPKRPCGVQILPDNSTILCGDKFGDVYSLPLLIREASEPETAKASGASPRNINSGASPISSETQSSFKPSATNLTVHTKRNRKALEAQMTQTNLTPRKEPLKFDHQLLLGHVSMLTDIIYTTSPQKRSYIITADRDEHIRVSRAAPQAHIIEGYCLGHTEYINKLCLVAGTPLLVSGGGDGWLGVWEWAEFRLVRKIDLKHEVQKLREGEVKVDVSGLWTVKTEDGSARVLVVAVEKLAALFILPACKLDSHKPSFTHLLLSAPAVDVVCVGNSMVVSVDERHDGHIRLNAFKLSIDDEKARVAPDVELQSKLQPLNEASAADNDVQEKRIDELLYGVANLRKRGNTTDGAAFEDGTAGDE